MNKLFEVTNTKFHENPSCGSTVFQLDTQSQQSLLAVVFRKLLNTNGYEDSNRVQKLTAIFARRFNSGGYRTFWQDYGVNFTLIFSCPLLEPQQEKGNISVTFT
jgi:hypothetical protein